jgi:hypothetical protein
MNRVFVLSPAHAGGLRAKMLLRPGATFELARQVQIGDARLGDVFTFCSGLYFRGKLGYARHFAQPPEQAAGVLVITPSRGLLPWDLRVGICDLEEFASVPVEAADARYTEPLAASASALARLPDCEVVLLGSIATGKYVDCLLPILGSRLLFPGDFIGRGDMSRGALLLRQIKAGEELRYIPVDGAIRHGRRAPRVAVSVAPIAKGGILQRAAKVRVRKPAAR